MHTRKVLGIAGVIVSVVTCSPAVAVNEVRVELRSFGSIVSTLRFNNDAPINLNIPTTVDQVNIFPHNFDPGSVPTLGRVTLIGTGSNARTLDLRVILGAGGFPASGVTSPLAAVAGDWKGIGVATTNPDRLSQSQVKLAGAINGSLLSTGGIQVGEISRFDFGGNVLAPVQTNHDGIYPMRLFAGAAIISNIEATQGNIRDVQATTLIANILATNGNIVTVRASGDMPVLSLVAGGSIIDVESAFDIGQASTPATIVSNGGNIHRVIAGGSAYADIQAIAPSPNGILATLSTNTPSGVYKGSVNVRSVGSLTSPNADGRLVFAGDLDGIVQVQSDLPATNPGDSTLIVGDEFLATSEIIIGGSVTTGSNPGGIRFAPGKLRGQVIINDNNAAGTWDANVRIGTGTPPTFLAPRPAYATENATLGNGSVGLVPFRLHDQSSSPPNNYAPTVVPSTALTSTRFAGTSILGSTPVPVELEFYGPVALPTSGAPVKIVMLDTCMSTPPDVTNRFAYSVVGRRLKIQRNVAAGFPLDLAIPGRFQVTLPNSGGLKCAGVPGDVLVSPFTYTFQLFADCDNDGTPYNAVTNVLEGGCGSTGYCDTIDFNRNGVWPEDQDGIDFDSVLAGGPCSTGTCGDIHFNNNGVFPEDDDVTAWFNTLQGGCMFCY